MIKLTPEGQKPLHVVEVPAKSKNYKVSILENVKGLFIMQMVKNTF